MKKKLSPFSNRDLRTQLGFPTLSWSSINAFVEYDKKIWYSQYVLGNRSIPNHAMNIGIEVGERITEDPTFLPTLERLDTFERELMISLSGITLRGHIDGSSLTPPRIDEYKTSTNKSRWTQKKVDSWGQLTMYALLYFVQYQIPPERVEFRLWAIPIEESGDFTWKAHPPVCFHTKRTTKDILAFAAFIKQTFKEMNEYIAKHKLAFEL